MEAAVRREVEGGTTAHNPTGNTWKPPPAGTYKLNTDVALREDGKVGLGMVVRDSTGDVLMIAGNPLHTPMEAKQGEAAALLFGMNYALDAGFKKIEAEVDCQALMSNDSSPRKNQGVLYNSGYHK